MLVTSSQLRTLILQQFWKAAFHFTQQQFAFSGSFCIAKLPKHWPEQPRAVPCSVGAACGNTLKILHLKVCDRRDPGAFCTTQARAAQLHLLNTSPGRCWCSSSWPFMLQTRGWHKAKNSKQVMTWGAARETEQNPLAFFPPWICRWHFNPAHTPLNFQLTNFQLQ